MGGATHVYEENEGYHDANALIEFKQGLGLLQKGYSLDAVAKLRHAASLEPHNAYFLSYLGLAVGLAQRKWAEAESLCMDALRIKRNLPQLYLNLAELYEHFGRASPGGIPDWSQRCAPTAFAARRSFPSWVGKTQSTGTWAGSALRPRNQLTKGRGSVASPPAINPRLVLRSVRTVAGLEVLSETCKTSV